MSKIFKNGIGLYTELKEIEYISDNVFIKCPIKKIFKNIKETKKSEDFIYLQSMVKNTINGNLSDYKIIGSFIYSFDYNDIDIVCRNHDAFLKLAANIRQIELPLVQEYKGNKIHLIECPNDESFNKIEEHFSYISCYRYILKLDGILEFHRIINFPHPNCYLFNEIQYDDENYFLIKSSGNIDYNKQLERMKGIFINEI